MAPRRTTRGTRRATARRAGGAHASCSACPSSPGGQSTGGRRAAPPRAGSRQPRAPDARPSTPPRGRRRPSPGDTPGGPDPQDFEGWVRLGRSLFGGDRELPSLPTGAPRQVPPTRVEVPPQRWEGLESLDLLQATAPTSQHQRAGPRVSTPAPRPASPPAEDGFMQCFRAAMQQWTSRSSSGASEISQGLQALAMGPGDDPQMATGGEAVDRQSTSAAAGSEPAGLRGEDARSTRKKKRSSRRKGARKKRATDTSSSGSSSSGIVPMTN